MYNLGKKEVRYRAGMRDANDREWTLDEVNALIDEARRNRAAREEKAKAGSNE